MDYGKHITIAAGTAEASKTRTRFYMWAGVIHQVVVKFPSGQEGTARCNIFQGSVQLWPTYRGEYYAGDGGGEDFREEYELHRGLNIIDVYTWNLDATNDHTIWVSFKVGTMEMLNPQRTFFRRFEEFLKKLGV